MNPSLVTFCDHILRLCSLACRKHHRQTGFSPHHTPVMVKSSERLFRVCYTGCFFYLRVVIYKWIEGVKKKQGEEGVCSPTVRDTG